MYSRVLDQQTFAAVIAAAPQVIDSSELIARRIVVVMAKELAVLQKAHAVEGQETYLEMSVKTLVGLIDGALTPKLVGAVARDMGLRTTRKLDGYYVQWNKRQVEILREYLGV